MRSTLRSLSLFATLLLLAGGHSTAATGLQVSAQRAGDLFDIQARATVLAPLSVVWGTLTDYERQPEFIPGLKRSRILGRNGATTTVEQSGEVRFLFVTLPIEVITESTERPPTIEVQRVGGPLRHLQGRYETRVLDTQPPQVLLRWVGRIALDVGLPPLIGEVLVRQRMQEQFEGMVHEIERRAQSLQPTPPASPQR